MRQSRAWHAGARTPAHFLRPVGRNYDLTALLSYTYSPSLSMRIALCKLTSTRALRTFSFSLLTHHMSHLNNVYYRKCIDRLLKKAYDTMI